jgi:hypothetical protein
VTFFARQSHLRQGATDRREADADACPALKVRARFFERGVGRGGDQLPQFGARPVVDERRRAAPARQSVGRAALALAAQVVCAG